jgi:hypothetical protein
MTLIVLTEEEAKHVRGMAKGSSSAALDPIRLDDGRYILGEEVLSDPAHAEHLDFLAAKPRAAKRDVMALLPKAELIRADREIAP